MDPGFTAEQDEIRRTLRALLHERCGPGELRAALDTPTGHDPALWAALAGRLGLPGLALPERHGGVGCPRTDLALAAEETGRVLAPTPLLATSVLAAPLILALGSDAQRATLLPPITDGTLTAALAVPAPALATALALTGPGGGDWAGGGRAGGVQARPAEGGGWRLYGEAAQVLDGHSAGLLLVAAHAGGFVRSRTLLFLVAGDAPGVVRTRQTALDATRAQARVQLRHVEAELLGADGGAVDEGEAVRGALADVGDFAAAFLACEAVGAAGRTLERTVEYLGQRVQFGRTIASFQAVQHRLADVYVRIQAARSAAYYAAWATGRTDDVPDVARDAGGLALAQALEALRLAASEAVQLHGGIGFTWEHEAHLYFKRAAGDELLFGPVHRLRAHAAERAALFTRTEVTV
ncbi:acyl-CoA dehydrogenase family protein [Streptomyces sp. NPDC048481]|uniref:acyl-CoA dehydrogenase family protein n=1 Tax=Streptomyces sp. NPDC048481 TaxID=3365557 RepID=UPI00371D45FC